VHKILRLGATVQNANKRTFPSVTHRAAPNFPHSLGMIKKTIMVKIIAAQFQFELLTLKIPKFPEIRFFF
jgi:hypothetical protein